MAGKSIDDVFARAERRFLLGLKAEASALDIG